MSSRILLGWAVAVTCALGAPIAGQARRPMTVEDLIAAPRIADPQLSPDGRTVLFVRTTTDGKTGGRTADIFAVAADGSGEPK